MNLCDISSFRNSKSVKHVSRPARRLLENQTAIVTGAGSGIGKSIAIALGAAGANVCVNFVNGPEKAEAVVQEIEKDGAHAFAQVDAPFTEMTRAQWQKVIDVNLTGQFLCAREAVREFRLSFAEIVSVHSLLLPQRVKNYLIRFFVRFGLRPRQNFVTADVHRSHGRGKPDRKN
jgi:NAD(P)-dependent dehydrogenase (short-subunit alcohol dehydrogenase family)